MNHRSIKNPESREDHYRVAAARRTRLAAAVCLALSTGLPVTAWTFDSSLTLNSDDLVLALDPYVLESEEVVTVQSTDYELSGTTLLQSKVFSTETGELRDVVIDQASGAFTSIALARAEEERRWREVHGALDLSLVEHLQTLQPDQVVEIVVLPIDTATTESVKGKKFKSPLEATRSALRKAGFRNATAYPEAGHVRVSASGGDIRSIVAFLPEVAAAYPWEEPATLGLKAAKDLIQAPLVPAHADGFGSDMTIAVYEPRACINRNHPDFQFVTFDERIGFESNCETGTEGVHATPVAGMLAASRSGDDTETIGLFRGHLFDVESGSFDSMIDRNPDFINISATTTAVGARSLDEAVYKERIFIANGSGNDSELARCYSYNALCVGGYFHKNTVGRGQFVDDTAIGSWLNDPESGREEPDVVGPFSVVSAKALGFGHTSENGTSFATPAITGLAALLTANYRSELERDPTLLRAVLMASASHPINNPVVAAPQVPDIDDAIDDRSGAGAPRGDRGRAILEHRRFLSENLDRDADFTVDGKLNRNISFEATRGATVRVVLAWDQCPVNLLSTRDALVADLDMVIDAPAGEREICDPDLSPACGDGSGSDDGSGSGFAIDDSYTTVTSTSYLTASFSTSTSLLDSTLVYEEPVVVAETETTGGDTTTTETTSTDTSLLSQFALPSLSLARAYLSNPSAVDNYEILAFRAPATGTYYVNITAPRWDVCEYDNGRHTNVAVAWDVVNSGEL